MKAKFLNAKNAAHSARAYQGQLNVKPLEVTEYQVYYYQGQLHEKPLDVTEYHVYQGQLSLLRARNVARVKVK